MVLKYLLISKSLCNISHFSVSQLFIQYWWIFTQSLLLSPPHIFGTVSPITVVQAQISRILGVTYITITKTFLVLNVRQFFKHFKQWVLPGHFAPILLLVVSTLRNPCHDLCYSICKLDGHHSFSAVFPPAASVMPFMSPHFFFGAKGQLQYHYLELFLASSSVLFKCNGLWYFNVLVNQQFNSFKKANWVPPSQVHFMQDPFPAECHISHAVRIVSPKMSHCAYLLFPPLSIFIFYLPGSPSWLAFNYCLAIFGICLLVGVHTPLQPKSHIPILFTFTQLLIICCLTPESGHL